MKVNAEKNRLAKTSKRINNWKYFLMALPGLLVLLIWQYIPMFGTVLAFKDYSYRKGIFGSAWVGFKHFENFFASKNFTILLRNTIGYNLLFLFTVNVLAGAAMALLLYEVQSKKAEKLYNTAMILPNFISFVIVGYIVLTFLNPSSGIVNGMLESIGMKGIDWYSEPKYWPYILEFVEVWKNAGMASLYYYAALLSIDPCLFEAAELDGAGRLKQLWHISVPEMIPMIVVVIIIRLGGILGGDWGLYYQVPMNQAALYSTTDVFSTYVYRGLVNGSISQNAAIGLFSSVAGLITIVVSNFVVKRIDPTKAVF